MVPGERYVREADVEPMMQLEIAEAVAVAVQSATDKLLDAVLSNLTKVATGEMRVVSDVPVVLPFPTTKACWQWMTEQRERREQAETVAQIRLEHIQALMAERAEQDKLVQTQGREIVGLTDQVQRQKDMIKEGWARIDTLADELAQARQLIGKKCEHEPPPVEHVHDQNERARQAATDEIKCELSKAFPAQFPFYAGYCE